MTDTRTRMLPQSVMPDTVIQLETGNLATLFNDSMPQVHKLTATQARMAVMMDKAGRDAPAIAERIGTTPHAVHAFLQQLHPIETVQSSPVFVPPAPTAPTPAPVATVTPKPAQDSRPDVDLTPLQLATVRFLWKTPLAASVIAAGMRIPVDQVLRIVGDAP